MSEEWKAIVECPGFNVSTLGRIKGPKGLLVDDPYEGAGFYRTVSIEGKQYKVHRLVALAFCPNDNPEMKIQVNHKDRNKRNNCADNLEWCTQADNAQHWADGYKEQHGMAHNEKKEEQLARAFMGKVEFTPAQSDAYCKAKDDLGEVDKGTVLAMGYKRCGRCGHAKKFYLFNKNSASKTHTSGNCKECQKSTASNSYKNTKQRRNYRKYYRENKALKQEHARKYYENNKDTIKVKHAAYLGTKGGKKVMAKAHTKRRTLLATNKGIPYTRAMVIDRDGAFLGLEHPICYLCEQPITDISGAGLHIDHVVPVAIDGLDCITNVASTHYVCNLKREKDARELLPKQVEGIKLRANNYIDAHPDLFQ
jgi:hypothetical protein